MKRAKYIVKVDEGYFQCIETPNRKEIKIVDSIQEASIYEMNENLAEEEIKKDHFIRWLLSDAEREGGTNPRLVKVSISEI